MKKLISLALTLAILASLAISVSAAEPELVVGDKNAPKDYTQGVEDFNSADSVASVEVLATVGGIQHRYAVDIDYTQLSVSVTGKDLVWDVVNLEYIIDPNPSSSPAANGANTTSTVVFTNRSDMPVYISYDVEDEDDYDFLSTTCTCVTVTDQGENQPHTLAKAVTGSAPTMTFNLAVEATDGDDTTTNDWNLVANYYANLFSQKGNNDPEVIATINFTVSKLPAQQGNP